MADLLVLAQGGTWDMRFRGDRVDLALFFGALEAWATGRWDELDPQPPLSAERLEALDMPPLSEMLAPGREGGLIRVYACSATAHLLLGLDLARVQASGRPAGMAKLLADDPRDCPNKVPTR